MQLALNLPCHQITGSYFSLFFQTKSFPQWKLCRWLNDPAGGRISSKKQQCKNIYKFTKHEIKHYGLKTHKKIDVIKNKNVINLRDWAITNTANISQVCLHLKIFSGLWQRGGKALECRSSGWSCRVRSDDVTFFRLQYATPKSIVMTKNLDAFIGGAPTKHEEYPRYVCPLTACLCALAAMGCKHIVRPSRSPGSHCCHQAMFSEVVSCKLWVQLCLAKWFQDECCEPGRLSRWSSICE